jgi:hypothetical protein
MSKRALLHFIGLAIFACAVVIATFNLPTDYESNTAQAKLSILWQHVLGDNNKAGTWYGAFNMLGLFTRSDYVTGHSEMDVMPGGRYKLIHTVGGIAKATIVWGPNASKYTGLFQGAHNVLVRGSCATEPDANGLTPALAFKVFRDGMPSGNVIAMYELSGQTNLNFFENNLCNHVAARPDFGLKLQLLGAKFRLSSSWPGCLGLSEFASYTESGAKVLSPKFPWVLMLQPNPELTKKWEGNTNTDIPRVFIEKVPQGSVLYKIFGVKEISQPSQVEYLGYMQTTSAFRASEFGDLTVFYKHTFLEEDMNLRPDWQEYFDDPAYKRDQTEGREIYEKYLPAWTSPI